MKDTSTTTTSQPSFAEPARVPVSSFPETWVIIYRVLFLVGVCMGVYLFIRCLVWVAIKRLARVMRKQRKNVIRQIRAAQKPPTWK